MTRKLVRAAVFAAAVTAVVGSEVVTADDKVPTVKEIMQKGHKGSDSLLKGIGADAKGGKWDDAITKAKALVVFGEALGKNKPGKGSEESWKQLTESYKEQTAAVAAGVKKKDEKNTAAALKMIGGSCKGCHDAHKG